MSYDRTTHEHHDTSTAHGVGGTAPGKSTLTARHVMRKTDEVQRESRDDNGVAVGADAAVEQAASSSGQALPGEVKDRFESSLGADLSSVRIHTGAESASAADAVGARAYTTGQDIHFGAGHYDPSSSQGLHLLAHEVAHTVQQQGGAPTRQHKLEVSTPGDGAEIEADLAADAMTTGTPAKISSFAPLARSILRDDDPATKALPSAPSFSATDGSFRAMTKALESSLKGDGGSIPDPAAAFTGSSANFEAFVAHAQSSHTYYSTNGISFDPGNLNPQLAKVAERDMSWGIGMVADVRVAHSATSSFVSLANSSNDAWSDLVKCAESLSIEVGNKEVPANSLSRLGGAEPKGDQEINATDVGGYGMGLAGDARRAGVIGGPDSTGYKKAMQEYTSARDSLANKERRVVSSVNSAKTAIITKKKDAATEEKEKWETISKAVDTFETGIKVAVSGGAYLEGEMGAAKITEEAVTTKPLDVKETAGHAKGVLSKGIQMKIDKINKAIAAYTTQLGAYSGVAEAQNAKANIGEYNDALGDLRTKAKNVEDQQELMQQKLIEWGQKIDKELEKQGKAPKGSKMAAEAAMLLAKIRTAATATDGAIEAISGGSASLPTLYGGLKTSCAQKAAAEAGRKDPRARLFSIEQSRWSQADSAIGAASSALQRRQTQITALETEFLSTFAEQGASNPAGSPVGKTY